MTISLDERMRAKSIIERLQKTFGMDIPEMGLKMSIKPNYLYSIKGEYKHKNGTPHCPPEAVRDVLTWGDRA